TVFRIPLEGLLLVAVLLVLPLRLRRPVAVLAGMALALLVLVKALDIGFSAVLDRRFHEAYDWSYLGLGYAVLGDWIGDTTALVVLVVAAVVLLGVLVLLVPATLRVAQVVADHPRTSWRVLAAASGVWVLCALTGLQVLGTPLASVSTSRVA